MPFIHDLFNFRFLQYAVIAALLAAIPAGVVGCWVVVRRNTYVAGAISHCILAGIGLAVYLQRAHGVAWFTPQLGAALAALAAAFLIGMTSLGGRSRTDSLLSAIWAVGMALGVSLLAITPGYQTDLMGYLFGNILMVGPHDLMLMVILNLFVAGLMALSYHRLLAISFNPEMARLRGIPVELYELLFMVVTALTIVLLVQVIGIVLSLALLTLPAATAGLITRRLNTMIVVATLLTATITIAGLAISYSPGWPAGATIVELAALIYGLVALVVWLWRRLVRAAPAG